MINRVKKAILFMLCILMVCPKAGAQSGPGKNGFVLDGRIMGQQEGVIYLIRYDNIRQQLIRDSAVIHEGRFQLKGAVAEPVEFSLSLSRQPYNDLTGNTVPVFIEPGHLSIRLQKDDFKNALIEGSSSQQDMDELNRLKAPLNHLLAPLSLAYDQSNRAYIAAMKRSSQEDTLQWYLDKAEQAKEAMDPLIEKLNEIEVRFIKDHPSSYVSASIMRYKTGSMNVAEIEFIYERMPLRIRKGIYGSYIRTELDKLKEGSPGARAYVFASSGLTNHPVILSDFRGKYVLLDFWASWCVPCRKGNPHLIDLYHQYNGRGFEIIGISDDDSKPEAWKKAVEKDGVGIWNHVLRGLKRTSSGFDRSADISNHYGIHTLPTKILIDPQGMIIGRYGGGGEEDEALDKKLGEVFAVKK